MAKPSVETWPLGTVVQLRIKATLVSHRVGLSRAAPIISQFGNKQCQGLDESIRLLTSEMDSGALLPKPGTPRRPKPAKSPGRRSYEVRRLKSQGKLRPLALRFARLVISMEISPLGRVFAHASESIAVQSPVLILPHWEELKESDECEDLGPALHRQFVQGLDTLGARVWDLPRCLLQQQQFERLGLCARMSMQPRKA